MKMYILLQMYDNSCPWEEADMDETTIEEEMGSLQRHKYKSNIYVQDTFGTPQIDINI